jgi:chlorite dismutase
MSKEKITDGQDCNIMALKGSLVKTEFVTNEEEIIKNEQELFNQISSLQNQLTLAASSLNKTKKKDDLIAIKTIRAQLNTLQTEYNQVINKIHEFALNQDSLHNAHKIPVTEESLLYPVFSPKKTDKFPSPPWGGLEEK